MTDQTKPDYSQFDEKDPVDRVHFDRMHRGQAKRPDAMQLQKLRLISDGSDPQLADA